MTCQSCNGTGAWPDGRGCGTCEQTGLAEFHPATTWNPARRISDIYAGMGADAPALFMLQREWADPAVVAHLVFDGEPQSKARARMARNGHVYTPQNTRESMALIGATFREQVPNYTAPSDVTFGVMALFYCATWQRRDVDNMLKLILDGLNRVAWADDSQVTEVSGRLVRGVDEPRTEVVIYQTMAATAPTRACLHCGTPFRDFVSQRKSRKFCTKECGYAHRKAARTRVCEQCKQEFSHRGSDESPRFCSVECKARYGRVDLICTQCGGDYSKARSVAARMKFQTCSPECYRALRRQLRDQGVTNDAP